MPSIVPGEDPDVDAVVEAYTIVFDSGTTYDEKVPYLVDSEGLEDTVDTYAGNGDMVGGVSVDVTEVTVDGDAAVVVFTLQFAGNPTYPGQVGDAVRTDGTWQITRDMFCGLMASARSSCPAE